MSMRVHLNSFMNMSKRLTLLCALFCMLASSFAVKAQSVSVNGVVHDKTGNPLSGASVTVKGTAQNAVTGADGKFQLTASANQSLVISFTGYATKTVSLRNATYPLKVVLEEDAAQLDEVVVTGLATTVKRRNSANAVAVVSAKDLTGTAPAQTFDAALNGKIVGANITANSGAPGGGISVKMRGVTTIYGNTQPLYVIDGVYVSNRTVSTGLNAVTRASDNGSITSDQDNGTNRIADINPADIENIEILKGASAAAIYGSQAAAGVVIITTKKGKSGKTRINVSQDLGVLSASHLLGQRQFTAETAANLGGSATSTNPATIAARAAIRQQFLDAQAAGKIYDYEKELYGEKGFIRNSRISLNGGNDKTTFFLSSGTQKEDGIIKGTGYQRSSIRLNVDHRITNTVKVGLTSSYTNSSSDRGVTNNDNASVSFGVALAGTPGFMELHKNPNGSYPRNGFSSSNFLETRDKMKNNETINRFTTGFNFEAGLQQSEKSVTKLVARGGIDFYHLKSFVLFPSSLQFEEGATGGHNIQGNVNELNTNWNAGLVNVFRPNENLSFTTTAALTHEYGSYDNIINNATQLIGSETNINQAGAINVTQRRTSYRNDGQFVHEEVSINDYLNITAGVRFDKSTNNGDHKKYLAYPKGSVALNLSKMPFWKSNLINDLKLRAAYGESGNFPSFSSRFITLGGTNIGGLAGSRVDLGWGDPSIKAERQTELEVGVDMSLFNGRLNLELSYYNKLIKDLLLLSDVQGSTGFASKWVNGGNLRNRGIEVGLRTTPVSNKNLQWNSNVNFWLNRSKMTKLDVPAFDPGSAFGAGFGSLFIEEGKSVSQIQSNRGGVVTQVGDMEPDFQMNFFNEITFKKNLSLRFLLHWKNGGDNVNLTQLLSDLGRTSVDYDEVKGNSTAGATRLSQLGVEAPYVQDASFVRLREIGLYYRLPLTSKVLQNVRVGVSANNFFTWTNYKGYDPEVSNFGAGFGAGVDVAPFPPSKRLQFHLSFDF